MKLKITFLFFVLTLCFLNHTMKAQTVTIPDTAFEQLLIDMEIDSDGIINGQIVTVDAEAVTTLIIAPEGIPTEYINDLTGIEAFVNLEELTVHNTLIEELNVSSMPNLTYLDCANNMLYYIYVSNNSLLEHLDITSGGDVEPFNSFEQIDLSNNPNIKKLLASGGVNYINLKNGNNNGDTYIDISAFVMDGPPETEPYVCIEVDNGEAAENNQAPYSEWTIVNNFSTYALTESCQAYIESFENNDVSIYPNPATDILNITIENADLPDNILLYDIQGREVKCFKEGTTGSISLHEIPAGVYILKIIIGNQAQTKKLIIK